MGVDMEMIAVWLGTVIVAVLGAVVAYLRGQSKGKDAGKAEEQARQTDAALQAGKERSDVDQGINRLPDGGAADRLRDKYARD